MLEENYRVKTTSIWLTAMWLLMALFFNAANAQDIVSPYECVRMDTFDVHPLHNEKGVKTFAALIDASKQMGVLPLKEALTRAFEAADAFNLRPERVAIAFQLLLYYSAKNDTREKRLEYANLVKNDITLLANSKHSEAWNLIAYSYAVSGDVTSALTYYQKAYETADSTKPLQKIYPLGNLADTYLANQDTTTALQIIHRLVNLTSSLESEEDVAYNHVYDYTTLARIHLAQGAVDSSAHYVTLAIENSARFKKGNHRYQELQSLVLPITIRLRIAEKNKESALQNIALLETIWPSLAMLLKAEYYESIHEIEKALSYTALKIEKDLNHDRSRIKLRRKLARSLGKYKIAEEASSQLWEISKNNLELSKKSLVTLSRAQMEGFEKQRRADNIQYEQQLELLRTRQRTWIAFLLILLSLGVATWFNHRYKKSILKSKSLSKIVSQHEQDLVLANKALATKVKSMEQFNHLLSHDLREPLRSISGFTSLLKKKVQAHEELSTDFSLLSNSVDQLTHLMAGVELLRAVEERNVEISRTSISKTISRVKRSLREKYPDHTIEISVKGYLDRLNIDEQLLSTSLREVMDNAAKFCKNKTAFITIEVLQNEEELTIYVQDEGIGMSDEYREQIFGLFKRLNRRENYSGAGVGLTMAKLAAEKCLGSITFLESHVGKGSTFKLTFPFEGAIQKKTTLEEPVLQTW